MRLKSQSVLLATPSSETHPMYRRTFLKSAALLLPFAAFKHTTGAVADLPPGIYHGPLPADETIVQECVLPYAPMHVIERLVGTVNDSIFKGWGPAAGVVLFEGAKIIMTSDGVTSGMIIAYQFGIRYDGWPASYTRADHNLLPWGPTPQELARSKAS